MEIIIGTLHARQCAGHARKHARPFIGISDIGQLTYCQIQATISQLSMQEDYRGAAKADDRIGGTRQSTREELSVAARADAMSSLESLGQLGGEWELRRIAGNLAESLELSGTSSERRHFECGDFFVIGIPDALTADAATEFGTSTIPRLSIEAKVVQCNLYTVLWGRSSGRAIVAGSRTAERVERIVKPNAAEAERWLTLAWDLLRGARAPRAPATPGKCRPCRFNTARGCPFPRTGLIPAHDEMIKIAKRHGR